VVNIFNEIVKFDLQSAKWQTFRVKQGRLRASCGIYCSWFCTQPLSLSYG